MKRLYLFLSTLMLVMAAALPFAVTAQNNASVWDGGAEFWTQGQGTASSPYLIENARQLACIAEMVNAGVTQYDDTYFKLTTDVYIDSLTEWQPIGQNGTYYFGGHFDGNNHTVTLYLNTTNMYAGIFGYAKNGSFANLTSAGQVKRTGSGAAYVGGICGYSTVAFTNCHNFGSVSSASSTLNTTPYAGGICGYSTATFTNCQNTGSVSSSFYAGGICGYSTSIFYNCQNAGSVSSSNSYNRIYEYQSGSNYSYDSYYYRSYAGGICGYSTASHAFPNCNNTGDISSYAYAPYSNYSYSNTYGYYYAYSFAGGICGYSGTIDNCHNSGNISSSSLSLTSSYSYSYTGGICGHSGATNRCYNTGDISANSYYSYVGGICGNNGGTVTNCYNLGNISSSGSNSSSSYSGGICGWRSYTIKNCYNVGSLLSGTKGGIFGGGSGNITNCYYLNTCGHAASTGGIAKTEASMKSVTFPVILNSDSVAFVIDITPNLNQGYPVFGSVSTQNANNVGATTATLHGSYQMRYAVDAHGFEYKKSNESTYTAVNAVGSSPVSYNVSGLQGGTEYTYRFFIQKNGATYRGSDVTFTTAVCSLAVQITSSSSRLCEGDTITYTAVPSGGAGYQYTWSNGSHSSTINVTNNATYTVTVTDNIGCRATASKQTALSPAAAVSISGNTVLSNNSSTTLTASGANNYLWNTGSTSASITVSPTTTTTYSVTGTNSYGCQGSASVTVTFCQKPSVTTNNVSSIGTTTAICGGNVTSDGGADVTARGVCWSTSQNPTISNSHTTNGSGTGSFTSSITGLTPNTTYYVRAYATNSAGTNYGAQKTFTTSCNIVYISIADTTTIDYGQSTTLTAYGASSYSWSWSTGSSNASITVSPTATTTYTVTGTDSYGCTGTASVIVTVNYNKPTVTTNNVSSIGTTTATCGGNVTATGGANVTARGVCWSTSSNPTVSGSHTSDGSGTGSFTSSITGLTPNTTYYVRAYATNSVGTSYGTQKMFTTSCNTMNVSIAGTTTINAGSSTTLTASGANSYIWSTGSSNASISVSPTATTTYTVTGTNIYGCTATASVTVTVTCQPPTVTTKNIISITTTSAKSGGNVTATGGADVTARGVCWSTSQNPTISNSHTTNGNGTGSFTSSMTGLTPNTTYYVRAYATNSAGTGYGTQKTFTTSCNTVTVSIAGNTTIDYGNSTTLTASGANSYSWSNGGTSASITVSPTATTTYTVTGTNSYGCTGTASVTVTVNRVEPTVKTNCVTNIAKTIASCGGNVTSCGSTPVTARGVCWSTGQNPTTADAHTSDGSGAGAFTSSLTGLEPGTTYHVRAYATSSIGTAYGNEVVFTTNGCSDISLPYTENFDDYTTTTTTETGVQPECWEVVTEDAALTETTKPQMFYGYATSGSYSLRMKSRCVYAMPALDSDVDVSDLEMRFNLRQPNSAYRLQVGVVDENGDFEPMKTINNASTDIEAITVNFANYTGEGRRIAFRNTLAKGSNLVYSTNYIDDIVLTISCGVHSLPYTDNFDRYTTSTTAETGVQPECWEVVTEDVALTNVTKPQVYYNASYATSGSYTLRMKNRCVYAMPALDSDVDVSELAMRFKLRQPKAVYRLQVGVVNEDGEFEVVKTINNASTDMEEITVDFSGYVGGGHLIAFRNTLASGSMLDYSVNYIDDIVLDYSNYILCGIEALPYTENFDSYTASTTAETGVQPDCWDVVAEDVALTNATMPQMYYNAAYAASGSYTLRMKNRCIYAMPVLSRELNVNELAMQFKLRQPKAVYRLQVGVVNDNGEFEPVKTINNASTDIEEIKVDFTNYTGNGHRVAFRNTLANGSTLDYSVNYIDDIVFYKSCKIQKLPYEENFDEYTASTTAETGVQPDCWEVVTEDVVLTNATKPQVYYNASYATSGSYTLRMKNRCVYAMPALKKGVNLNEMEMRFSLRQPNSVYRLQVGVVNENGEFEVVKNINNTSTGVEEITVDFANYTGNGHRVAFRNTLAKGSTLDYSVNYIDDIVFAKSCKILELPYTENFDGFTTSTTAETGMQPDCWEVITEDVSLTNATKPQVYYSSVYSTSGSYTLRMKNRCVFAMPELNNANVRELTMSFNLRQPNSVYRLQVGVVNENGEFKVVKTINNATTAMEPVTVNFSNYTGNGRRIAFRNTLSSSSTLDYSVNYIDDINIFRTTNNKSMEVTDANADDAGMLGADRDMLDIVVYPNPTKDVVNVQCTMNNVQGSMFNDQSSMDNVQGMGIEVIDVYGKVVRTVGLPQCDSRTTATQINVSGIAAGMYFVRVTTDRGVVTKPFVKR